MADAFSTGATAQTAIVLTGGSKVNAKDAESTDAEKLLEVNSAITVEREITLGTIGTVFANDDLNLLPYVEQSNVGLVDLLAHYYEGIRNSAADSPLQIVRLFYKLSDPQACEQGISVRFAIPSVKDLIGHTTLPLSDMYDTEDDK